MRNINLIHISDLHMDNTSLSSIDNIINCIIDDLSKYKNEHDITIDIMCFTGDIINSGRNNGELYNIALSHVINPIIEAVQLEKNNFFACQGNHENDLSLLDEIIYEGINSHLKDENKFRNLWKNGKIFNYINDSTTAFNNFFASINSEKCPISELSSYAIRQFDNYSIGFAILNSSWRSCGKTKDDYGNLILGAHDLEEILNKIENTNFKIAMFHHPIEYICEVDRIECEKLLNKFDLVLNGHTHDSEQFQKFSEITNTLYLTAGQLNDTTGVRNGYAIVEINPFTKQVCTTFRKYFSKRRCFDISSEENQTGKFTYNLSTKNDALKEAYQLSKNSIPHYKSLLKEKLITNIFYAEEECRYIEPYIKNSSEFTELSSNDDDLIFSTEDMLISNTNYSLFGKANYGKSTTLKILAYTCCSSFEKYQKLPIFIDFNNFDFKGKSQILRGIKKVINDFRQDIKFDDVILENMLSKNYIIVLIDNFDVTDRNHTRVIEDFVNMYPSIQIIVTQQEDILDYCNFERKFENFKGFKRLYLQPVKKYDIIEFAEKCTDAICNENIYSIIDKTTGAISELGMGKNPFNVIMLMNIYNDDNDYTVINEANVVERFMELLLEKVNIIESDISTFDFRNKEDFLMSVAKYMNDNNNYVISITEYNKLIEDFFRPFGMDYQKSKFDTLFFEKKVLLNENGEVSFSYKFILEYYIAKSFITNGLPKNIFDDTNYLRYANELNYYSGINRYLNNIFDRIETDVQEVLNDYKDIIQCEEEYKIALQVNFTAPDKPLSIAQKSELTDRPDTSQEYNPHNYSKEEQSNSTELTVENKFSKEKILTKLAILNVYSRLLRNMDYLPVERKKVSINNCINYCCIILNLFCEDFTSYVNEKYTEFNENGKLPDNIEYINDSISMFKMIIPVVIENMLFQWIGNKKLLPVFDILYNNNEYNSLGDFFFSILYLDLKSPNSYDKIKRMIKQAKNESVLKLLYVKLISIYMTTTSSYEEKKIETLIIDLVDKQNPPKRKASTFKRIDKNATLRTLRDKKKNFLTNEI